MGVEAMANLYSKARELMDTLGRTLTAQQQIEISKILIANPNSFSRWLDTDNGRQAIRALADKYIDDVTKR